MHSGYRFWKDPLWWCACLAYVTNRFLIVPLVGGDFLRGQFDDLWFIPAALPLVLELQSLLRLRPAAAPPSIGEVAGHWLVWSIVSEGVVPLMLSNCVADWRDVVAYGIGALIAAFWWRRWPQFETPMSFDPIAPHYRWMERILAGNKLQRCRTAFLPEIRSPSRILLMGEGHGRFLEICRRQFPTAEITVVDASAGMLSVAQRHCCGINGGKGIQFVHCNCLDWDPGAQKFDLIATHFFLDCFRAEQLAVVIPKLANVLTKDGAWIIGDFRMPERGWRRARAQVIHAMMYHFFKVTTGLQSNYLTPPDSHLTRVELHLEQRREWEWGLLHADLWRKN